MNIEEILQTIGLNKKEARVYLACLKTGQETAFNIATKSGLKRSTVYFVLDKLVQKGFASIKQTPKATYYSVISPKKLLLKIEKQKDEIQKILPELEKDYREQPHKPLIQVYEGKEGLELIYRSVEEYLQKGKEVFYFGSASHFLSKYAEYKDLLDLWIKLMKNKRFGAREILIKKELASSDYLKKILKNDNPNHQIRFFPKGINFTKNDNMIFGNKLIIFSLEKEVFAVVIDSTNIAESYRNVFEMLWLSAKKI